MHINRATQEKQTSSVGKLYTIQFIQKIKHNTIYTEDYTQHNLYRRLYTIQFIQKIIHNTIYTENYTQYNLYRSNIEKK